MKTKITSIHSWDAKKTFVEFLTKEFREQQLGQPGRWFLLGDPSPFLHNPVQVAEVKLLIDRSDRDNTAQGPVAWRLDFEVGRATTTLWALGSQPMRGHIEQGHRLAVKTALIDWLPKLMESHRGFFGKAPNAISALFASGTGKGQTPNLHTTAFLFNTNYLDRVQRSRLSEEKVARSQSYLDSVYDTYRIKILSQVLGRIGSSRETAVPSGLFSPLSEQFLNMHGGQKYFDCGGPFTGEAIFAQWRRQAEARGFGPMQVEAVLRNAKGESMRNEATSRERTKTQTFGETVENRMRHGHGLFKNTRTTPQPLVVESEKPITAHGVQQTQKNQMFHSY